MLTHFIMQYQRISFSNSTTKLSRKVEVKREAANAPGIIFGIVTVITAIM